MKLKHLSLGIVLLAQLLAMASCGLFRDDVYGVVRNAYESGLRSVDLGEALWFDWDTMYWFPSNIPLDEINSMVDINGFWQDVGDRVVFVKGGKVVCYDEFFPYHETPMERICLDPDSVQVIRKEDALFLIRKAGDRLYVLSQTGHPLPSGSVGSDGGNNLLEDNKPIILDRR